MTLGTRLHEDHPQEKFSASVSPQCVELPNLLFNNKDLESESYQQLKKLTHAGLLEEWWNYDKKITTFVVVDVIDSIDNQVNLWFILKNK